jgi:hypothetical protein
VSRYARLRRAWGCSRRRHAGFSAFPQPICRRTSRSAAPGFARAPDSAATAAGLQPNDVIVAVDGQPINAASSLTADIAAYSAGDRVTLAVIRPSGNGIQRLTLTASLGDGAAAAAPRPDQTAARPADDPSAGAAAGSIGSVQWTSFSDPNEQAFTAEVPAGWTVKGGLVRHTSTDPSILIRMVSPDRRSYLMIGDPGVTLWTTPAHSMFGRGPSGPATRAYLSGAEFARNYVDQSIPSVCANPVVTGQKARPDLAQGPWTKVNPQAHHDGGEATFTCQMGGAPAQGIVAAATYIYQMPGNFGGNLWTADFLAGVVAPPGRYDAGVDMVRHVVASLHINAGWMQRQQQATAQAARAIDAATQRTMQAARALDRTTQQNIANGDQIIASQQRRMHASDQQEESFDRLITGVSPYADSNGNVHDMSNIPAGHWINSGGGTATTNGALPPPGVGWETMHEVPPQ